MCFSAGRWVSGVRWIASGLVVCARLERRAANGPIDEAVATFPVQPGARYSVEESARGPEGPGCAGGAEHPAAGGLWRSVRAFAGVTGSPSPSNSRRAHPLACWQGSEWGALVRAAGWSGVQVGEACWRRDGPIEVWLSSVRRLGQALGLKGSGAPQPFRSRTRSLCTARSARPSSSSSARASLAPFHRVCPISRFSTQF
jgi:hypothetical protein